MAKARRVENAITFWQNQRSFHLSPQKHFYDSGTAALSVVPKACADEFRFPQSTATLPASRRRCDKPLRQALCIRPRRTRAPIGAGKLEMRNAGIFLTRPCRNLKTIFSDDSLPLGEQPAGGFVNDLAAETCASISFSASSE